MIFKNHAIATAGIQKLGMILGTDMFWLVDLDIHNE
jgi:hypothetical protein